VSLLCSCASILSSPYPNTRQRSFGFLQVSVRSLLSVMEASLLAAPVSRGVSVLFSVRGKSRSCFVATASHGKVAFIFCNLIR
jgi:ABC-type phosphate transport system permease subunit